MHNFLQQNAGTCGMFVYIHNFSFYIKVVFLVFFHFLPSTLGLCSTSAWTSAVLDSYERWRRRNQHFFYETSTGEHAHSANGDAASCCFVEYTWQLQSQRISRSNRAYGCLWSGHQFPTLLPSSPCACKMQNS